MEVLIDAIPLISRYLSILSVPAWFAHLNLGVSITLCIINESKTSRCIATIISSRRIGGNHLLSGKWLPPSIVAGLWGRGWGMGLLYPHLLGETQSKRNSVKQEIRYKGYQPKPNILYVSFTMMMKIASDFGHTSMTRFNLVLQLRIPWACFSAARSAANAASVATELGINGSRNCCKRRKDQVCGHGRSTYK